MERHYMCICLYVCVYVCICVYVCVYACSVLLEMSVCMCVCLRVFVYMCVSLCVCLFCVARDLLYITFLSRNWTTLLRRITTTETRVHKETRLYPLYTPL